MQNTEELGDEAKAKERPVFGRTKSNIIEILKCTNATPIRCMIGIGYTCCFCEEKFADPCDLKRHTLAEHDIGEGYVIDNTTIRKVLGDNIFKLCVKLDITSLTCKLCTNKIETLDDLFQHLINKHERLLYTDINGHIFPFKFNTEKLCCCICSKESTSFKHLLEHMNTHYSNYVCNICCAGFVNKAKLQGHEVIHALGEYKCSFCPKILATEAKKKNHEKSNHTHVNKINKCGHCGEKFNNHRKKVVHMFEVHGIPLPKREVVFCGVCGKEFAYKSLLTAHIRRVHLMEKMCKCETCGKEFFGFQALTRHLPKHTGKKDFQCSICLKWYGRQTTLREHMKIHQDERRFKCEHCGQTFVKRCSWRGHMRAKHGEVI